MTTPGRHFDLIVIGSGPAGEAAIKEARRLDTSASLALIEKDRLGGDCPNLACVPTKALLRSARVYSLLRRAGEFGLQTGEVGFDWERIVRRKDRIVREAAGHDKKARGYERDGIALFRGAATFADAHHVAVGDADGEIVLRGAKILIATGSGPLMPPIAGIERAAPITSDVAIALETLPTSLIVLGGGPVGCEFAELFATFDVRVTLIEGADALLSREEPELSARQEISCSFWA